MKITQETKLWIVTDPTDVSVLADICWPATLFELELQILGAAMAQYRMSEKNMTIYTDCAEAEADAESRLNARSGGRYV